MTQKQDVKLGYYKAEIDSLFFNMTPTLYKVVMGVINTLNKTGTEKKQIEEENKELLMEASEPFKIHQIKDENSKQLFSYFSVDLEDEENANNNNNNQIAMTSAAAAAATTTPITTAFLTELLESLDLKINKAFITFCDETGIDLQPLAVVKLTLNGRISNWTRNLHCKADLDLEASYYNDRLSNWEPLIENVMQKEDKYRPFKLKLWFAINPSRILQPPSTNKKNNNNNKNDNEFPVLDLDYSLLNTIYLNDNIQTNELSISNNNNNNNDNNNNSSTNASYLKINSEDVLNLNVTPSAYKVIMYLGKIAAGTDKDKLMENKNKAQLKFLNFLDEKATLTVSADIQLRQENAKNIQIKHRRSSTSTNSLLELKRSQSNRNELNNRIEQIVNNSQKSQIDTMNDDKYKFNLLIDQFEELQLSFKTDGSYLIQLKKESNEYISTNYNMMFKVKTSYGRTKVNI